jgi:alpha-ketoglutarate-dependent taurine dioxygenase
MTAQKPAYQHITVAPLTGALGAEIGGVDLARPLSDGALAEIRRAFVENLVIVFRDQDLTPEQHKAFARHFGDLHINDFFPRVEGHDDVQLIVKEPDDVKNVGEVWHSDVTYKKCPALGSLLYAREVPPYGGDTMFANMYLAYETLSPGMRALLRGLTAQHSAAENFAKRAADARDSAAGFRYSENAEQDAVHPAIRTHPESGRDALYVNSSFTKGFAGLTREESAPILGFLFGHLSRPEFTCRLRWRAGTLAFWDNRCAQHFAINDYHGHRRHMNRVTVLGDEPFLAERAVADAA